MGEYEQNAPKPDQSANSTYSTSAKGWITCDGLYTLNDAEEAPGNVIMPCAAKEAFINSQRAAKARTLDDEVKE